MDWKLKVDDDNNPVLEEGKPVYIDPDGKELALDPPAMYQKITKLGQENQTHREKYQSLKDTYKVFDGIEDIAEWHGEATKAMKTVENFNDKDYIKASKVEEFKDKIKADYQEKLDRKDIAIADLTKEYEGKLGEQDTKIRNLMVSGKFASSKYFVGSDAVTSLTPEIAESFFGKNFKVEEVDGKLALRAYYSNGDAVLSKKDPGEPAEFEEAMGFIIEAYPGKDSIMRTGGPGSGAPGGGSGPSGDINDEIATLKKQHKEAIEAGKITLATSLKSRIFEAQQKAS